MINAEATCGIWGPCSPQSLVFYFLGLQKAWGSCSLSFVFLWRCWNQRKHGAWLCSENVTVVYFLTHVLYRAFRCAFLLDCVKRYKCAACVSGCTHWVDDECGVLPPVFGLVCVASHRMMTWHMRVNSPMAQRVRMYEAMERVGWEQKRTWILYKTKALEWKTATRKLSMLFLPKHVAFCGAVLWWRACNWK